MIDVQLDVLIACFLSNHKKAFCSAYAFAISSAKHPYQTAANQCTYDPVNNVHVHASKISMNL